MNVSLVIAYVIAIAIPLFSVYLIFALDLFGTGKLSTVIICALWGGIGAFGLAYMVNSNVMLYVGYITTLTLTGPIAEEILKSLVMFYFITRPGFRYVVDGAVYGFAAGIGFAVTENLFYLSAHPEAGLSLALSRVLSTSLMHATTSALIGISLGHLRRSRSTARFAWALLGFVPAMLIHIIFNNAVNQVTNGTVLLLIGIAIGMGGAAVIAFLISQGIAEEKRRFSETLGLGVGVSTAERKAVQDLGGSKIEQALQELAEFFGEEKVALIRRLLVTQANIGILQNNLSNLVSERLRKAWEDEITAKRAEIDMLRNKLGVYVMTLLRGVFPDDTTHNKMFQREFAASDLTLHKFDLFMNASQLADTVSSHELGRIADLLKQIDIFKEVSLPDLENLSRAITTRTFAHGEVIFEEGAPGDTMYLIEQGAIMLFNKTDSGSERLLNTCYPGGMVGELGLLDGYPRSARARANGELRVLILRREHFMMFIQSRPPVILALLTFLAGRARHISAIVDVSIKWASDVAQGNYEPTQAVSSLVTASATEPHKEALSNTALFKKYVPHAENASVSEEAHDLLRGVFSKVSGALEQREQTIKAAPTNAIMPDIGSLPEVQQRIIRFLRDSIPNAEQGATVQALQTELPDIANLPDILVELSKSGWLSVAGQFYKAAPRIERGSQIMRRALAAANRGDKGDKPAGSTGSTSIFARIKVD